MNNVKTPFNLSPDYVWLLEVVLPIIIAIAGWIYVNHLNRKNMKEEKKIIIKTEAYNYLKISIDEVIRAYSHLNSFLFITYTNLQLSKTEETAILFNMNWDCLFKEFKSGIFDKLNKESNEKFINFIFEWEQYEIIFQTLLPQRIALQKEHDKFLTDFPWIYSDYYQFFNQYELKIQTDPENQRLELSKKLEDIYNRFLDFHFCICDVRNNMQNYVFSKIIENKIPKRIVKEDSFMTIDSLIKKHKVEGD